jgi:hypothetical protein
MQEKNNLADDDLFAGIELGALVDVIATGVAVNANGVHHVGLHLLVLGPPSSLKLRVVEVRRVVLVLRLSLSHSCDRSVNDFQSEEARGVGFKPG